MTLSNNPFNTRLSEVVLVVDGDECLLPDFIEANEEGFTISELHQVIMLLPGRPQDAITLGGGASSEITIWRMI